MANQYTQIFQSQYVPQFDAPNISAYKSAADTLYSRQQQGMKQYDALQESLGQLDVLASDQEILQKKTQEINNKLSQFSDENDFIDAMPAIRREARNLTKDMQEGQLGTAIQNKQNAMETFKAIDESDWSPQKKEQMKDMYLEGYQGASSGQSLSTWTPPEYINVQEEVSAAAKEVEKTEQDFIQMVEDQTTGGMLKAKVTKKGRNQRQIREAVVNKIVNNPNIQSALTTEARLNGARSPEEINKYIADKAESLSTEMVNKFGPQSEAFSNIQWDDAESLSPTTKMRQTVEPGILQPFSAISDLSGHVDYMKDAAREQNPEQYKVLKNQLDIAFTKAMEQGVVDGDDYQYFMDNIDRKNLRGQDELEFSPFGFMSGIVGGEPADRDRRFSQIGEDVQTFLEDSGGEVGSTFMFEDPKKKADAASILSDANPQNFKVISKEFVEDKDEKGKLNYIKDVVVNGEFEGITMRGDDAMPLYKYRYRQDDDEPWQTVFLKEQSTPNIKEAGYKTPFEHIVNTTINGDPVADQLLGAYKLHNIPATGQNVYEELPIEYRAGISGADYVSLEAQQGGEVTLDIGSGDDHKKLTDWDTFLMAKDKLQESKGSNREMALEDFQTFAKFIQNSNTLLETEKSAILDSVSNLGEISPEVGRKLKDELDKPRRFSNKIDALNFARRINFQRTTGQ